MRTTGVYFQTSVTPFRAGQIQRGNTFITIRVFGPTAFVLANVPRALIVIVIFKAILRGPVTIRGNHGGINCY